MDQSFGSNRTPRRRNGTHSHRHEEIPRTPTSSNGSGDSNKENSSGGSGSKHRRISIAGAIPATPVPTSPSAAIKSPPRLHNERPKIDIPYPDGLPSLLFGGEFQSDDADKVIAATIQLKHFLRSSNAVETTRQFVALGGHALLVTAMQKWHTHQVIQYRLCASMADFTYHFPNAEYDLNIFSALVQMGALDVVVAAMARFPTVEAFQYTCMLIVGNLCTDVGRQCKQNHADQFVHRLQGVHLVCNAMKEFASKETIQQTGTWLFEVLCALGMAKAAVMKGEALASVALAVQAFPNNSDLNKDARSFMKMVIK